MKKPLKIGAYLRVSTDKQVQVFEGSLDTQKYRMQEFVKNRSKEMKAWGEIIDFYVEEGLSAGTDKRPEYQRLMADVRSGKINLILVSDISRLSRSVHDFSVLLKELERCNASYMSMKEQFDTTTPAGRLMINLVVNMAQFEREQTSERVSINCNSRALRGFVNGGRAGYGFERHKEKTGVLVVNEIEAEEIRTIFDTFKEQGSIGKTLPVIEALGIYPRGSEDDNSDNASPRSWTYNLMRDVLTNIAYTGMREVNKKKKGVDPEHLKPWQQYQIVKASWPAIVNQKTFDEVQKILEENLTTERRRLSKSEARIFLLSGVLTCGECGRPLCGQSAHGEYGVHRYYYHSYKRGEKIECSQKRVRADELEQVVVNHLVEIAGRAGYFERMQEKLEATLKDGPKQIEGQIKKTKLALLDIEKEIASTFKIQMSASGGSEAASLAAEHLETLGNKKKVLRKYIEDLEVADENRKDADQIREAIEIRVRDFKKGFAKASPATRRRMLKRILEKLILMPKGLEAHFRIDENDGKNGSQPFGPPEGGKVLKFEKRKQLKPVLSGSESDLSLLSGTLLNCGIGWGGRTRTCE
jgi:site-specific DNA recombinase